MSQSRMYVPRKSRFREHRPPRFLHNEIRETASIPVRQVRKDVLFDQGHALLPSPASKSYFRHGRRSQSRGCQYFRGCSGRGDCLEHRRALAREGGGRLPPFQQRTNQWIRRRGAPSRRDSLLRRQQGPINVDLRGDRSWVSSLAIDGGWASKLPEYTRPCARRRRPDGFRGTSTDRHRRIRFLREGRPPRFGPAVLYAQVLKTRSNDRIVKVERRELLGARWRFEEALKNSEDSSTLNTSFIERLNLTIRQSLAYLARRTLSHARSKEKLEEQLELVRCYYNFARPHGALKFGREIRTPAMQAGLATRRVTLREIFVCARTSVSILTLIANKRHRV